MSNMNEGRLTAADRPKAARRLTTTSGHLQCISVDERMTAFRIPAVRGFQEGMRSGRVRRVIIDFDKLTCRLLALSIGGCKTYQRRDCQSALKR